MSKQALHDLRAVYDVVSLHAERLAADAWVLVELRPDPYSGGAMTVGASVDGATGKLIDDATGRELAPEEAHTGLVFSGEWKIVDDSAASGRYSWAEPPKVRLQGLSAKDLYDPFASGGVVLCDLDLQASGREQFGRVRLIVADWTTNSAEARVALQANPDLLASTDLLSIVDGTNDVLLSSRSIRWTSSSTRSRARRVRGSQRSCTYSRTTRTMPSRLHSRREERPSRIRAGSCSACAPLGCSSRRCAPRKSGRRASSRRIGP